MRRVMLDPQLTDLLVKTISYGVVGSFIGGITGFFSKPSVALGKSAGVGFLIGAAFGATFGIFAGLMR